MGVCQAGGATLSGGRAHPLFRPRSTQRCSAAPQGSITTPHAGQHGRPPACRDTCWHGASEATHNQPQCVCARSAHTCAFKRSCTKTKAKASSLCVRRRSNSSRKKAAHLACASCCTRGMPASPAACCTALLTPPSVLRACAPTSALLPSPCCAGGALPARALPACAARLAGWLARCCSAAAWRAARCVGSVAQPPRLCSWLPLHCWLLPTLTGGDGTIAGFTTSLLIQKTSVF